MSISSVERDDLRTTVRRLFAQESGEEQVRACMAGIDGVDEALWKRLGADGLDVLGLHVPTEFGGAGYGLAELGIVLEEAGAALACLPLLSSAVLATTAILHSGDAEAAREFLPTLIGGSLRGTLAIEGSAIATPTADGWWLTGRKSTVLDGHTAGLLVVLADGPEGRSLFLVAPGDAGCARTPSEVLDQTRPMATIELHETPGRLLGKAGGADAVVALAHQIGRAALAAEQVGGARRAMETAVEYARTRTQFGRKIGSYQAIKHQCADMLIAVEQARAAAEYALHTATTLDADLPVASAVAKIFCSDAYSQVAAANVQVHGGIGFTWEHSAHLHVKRATSARLLLGDPARQRKELADHLHL